MYSAPLGWAALGIASAAAAGIFLTRDWRWHLGFMAAIYLGAATLALAHWPTGMAAAFLVTGWMSVAAVGMSLTNLPHDDDSAEQSLPQGTVFRAFMIGMVFVLAAGVAPRIDDYIPGIGIPTTACAVVLTGTGMLQLGTNARIASIMFGLLTVLAGFEVFYSAVEGSILVAGMLSAATLGLGLAGAYLLNAPTVEEAP